MLGSYLVSVNMERLLSSSFRNGVLFLGGGGEGKAFECLKEVMEKSTSRSLTVSGSVIPNY